MTLQSTLTSLIAKNQNAHPLYVRTVLKEELQNYVLNCVYTSTHGTKLIFTGGTCLRKVYGLNRLSEDLDFDYLTGFSIEELAQDVTKYFTSVLQYPDMRCSFSSNKQTVYFKFPILKELQATTDRTPEDLFVRCDVSLEMCGQYGTDKNLITAGQFQFLVTSYDLPTLFANKLVAFMNRTFYKGGSQKIPFKGRDVYDLFWLLQLSAKSGFSVQLNRPRLEALLDSSDVAEVIQDCIRKVEALDAKYLEEDLFPLLESRALLDGFLSSYREYIPKYLPMVVQK